MDAVEDIKSRLNIEDVVGRYVDLKRSGASLKGLCPFHQEKTPSFVVSPSRGTFHCFGCQKGGDVFTFVQEVEKLSFPDALKRLADQAGVALPERQSQKPSLKGKLYEANEAAAKFFRSALGAAQGQRAQRYLVDRHFDERAISMFELGYAPEGREALSQHLRGQGFDDRILLEAGLAVQDDVGGRLRDRFRGRLMFPIRDGAGRISGFGGRTLGDAQPKYLNSPQTEIFDKSGVLYGIHRSQDAIRQAGKAVLVEGYLDAIRAHVAGFAYTVASLGTAVTAQQLAGLARLTQTVILALDPDAAGTSAAARTSLAALADVTRQRQRVEGGFAALDLRIARLPEALGDPDELIRDHPEAWERALDESVPAFEFFFAQTMASLDRSTDAWRQEALDRLLPLIQQFASSAGWQAIWLERLGRETGIDPRHLLQSVPGGRQSRARPKTGAKNERASEVVSRTTSRGLASDPGRELERSLLALLLKLVVIPDGARRLLNPAELEDPLHRTIVETVLAWQGTGNYDFQMLRETLPEEAREIADELHARDVPLPEDGKVGVDIRYHLARLRLFRIKTQQERGSHLLAELDAPDRAAAVTNLARLMQERREVERALDELSRLALQSGYGTIDQDSGRL
ncbi:MAG: DNA primase [Chloroflexi bacterium]|nr:DNA primase [Chloroflexota bacterium]